MELLLSAQSSILLSVGCDSDSYFARITGKVIREGTEQKIIYELFRNIEKRNAREKITSIVMY